MRHTDLKLRMVVAGTALFGFYVLLATAMFAVLGSLPAVLGLTILFVGVQYKFGKWLALRSVNAEDMPEDRYPSIHRAADRLCEDMGIEKPRLMVAEMGSPNAFAVGRRGAGVVVIGTELLQLLSEDEVEGVLAHELAHIKNRDVLMMVLGQSVAMLFGWGVYFIVRNAVDGILGFIVAYAASILANLLVMLFVLVISRTREYAADSDAVEYTGNPEAMASALRKLRDGAQPEMNNDRAVSAMCIFNTHDGVLEKMFATHPPIEKRIATLEN